MNKKKLEYIVLIIFVKIFRLVGLTISRKICKVLGFIFYYIIPIRKEVIITNLQTAFPEKSLNEINELAYKNIQNTLITFVELFYLTKLSSNELLELGYVSDDFLFLLNKIKSKNKGAIYLTGHFGNWEFAAFWIGLNLKQKLNLQLKVLVKPQSNPYITELIKETREHFGNISVNTGASIRELFGIIKEKGIAGIVGDQRGPKELKRVKFFGQETAIYPGTAAISVKTGAPILVMSFIRDKQNKFKGTVEELSMDNLPDNKEDKIHEITQRYMNILEKYVRQYPDQYFWMHKLWKY